MIRQQVQYVNYNSLTPPKEAIKTFVDLYFTRFEEYPNICLVNINNIYIEVENLKIMTDQYVLPNNYFLGIEDAQT